jgi:hypothetical protein
MNAQDTFSNQTALVGNRVDEMCSAEDRKHYRVNMWRQDVQGDCHWYDRPADASYEVNATGEEEAVKASMKAFGWSNVWHAEVFDRLEYPGQFSYHVFDDYPHCFEEIQRIQAARGYTHTVEAYSRLSPAYRP